MEHLAYVYWWQDRYVAAMEAGELQYRKAWNELQHFDVALPLTISSETDGIRAQLKVARQQIRQFIKNTTIHRRWETAVRHQELRAQWVLEQLSLINTTSPAEQQPTNTNLSANGGKKRKRETTTIPFLAGPRGGRYPTKQWPSRRLLPGTSSKSTPSLLEWLISST